jgi:hypothetical protein
MEIWPILEAGPKERREKVHFEYDQKMPHKSSIMKGKKNIFFINGIIFKNP